MVRNCTMPAWLRFAWAAKRWSISALPSSSPDVCTAQDWNYHNVPLSWNFTPNDAVFDSAFIEEALSRRSLMRFQGSNANIIRLRLDYLTLIIRIRARLHAIVYPRLFRSDRRWLGLLMEKRIQRSLQCNENVRKIFCFSYRHFPTTRFPFAFHKRPFLRLPVCAYLI